MVVVLAPNKPQPKPSATRWSMALIAALLLASPAVENEFLSNTLGDWMVLQRAPRSAIVWGKANTSGATIRTRMGTILLETQAAADGIWRQRLPPMPMSTAETNLTFSASTGQTAKLSHVRFGDVFLCGGQSNMEFALGDESNRTSEIAAAERYPQIRLFTVGSGGFFSHTPLTSLRAVEQPWVVASPTSVARGGMFGVFSAVCWFFGRQVADANHVPAYPRTCTPVHPSAFLCAQLALLALRPAGRGRQPRSGDRPHRER